MSRQRSSAALFIVLGFILTVGIIFLVYVLPIMTKPQTRLFIGDGVFNARLALTQAERAKGLSGTGKLNPEQALLMVFPNEDKWPIWMKDMNFPIDIVWLDSDKKIIYIVKDASPEKATDEIFTPKSNAKYVLELPAGTVEGKVIAIDKKAVFQIYNQGT